MFYIGMAIVGCIGGFVQTMVGFGAAVCVLLYMTNFMDISSAPSITAAVCLALNISIVIQFRKSICLKKIWRPLIIYSVLSLIIVALVKSFQVTVLTIAFGVFLILIAVYYLFLANKIKIKDSGTGMMILSSSLSGLFSGLFSIGGPTLSIYYLAILGSGDLYIANLQVSFLICNVVLCAGRFINGLFTVSMLPATIIGIAGAIGGQMIAKALRGKLSTKILSILVYASVGLSGVLVIIQQCFI